MVKRSFLRRLFRFAVNLIVAVLVVIAAFIVWQTISEYRPDPEEMVPVNADATVLPDTLTLTTYNIGYCGLGAGMDFFYEGGTMVRPDKEESDLYLGGVMKRLSTFNGSDFMLLQEVDTLAKRSWYADQYRLIRTKFTNFHSYFVLNYKSWVPMPVLQPMGKVRAGLLTLSKAIPVQVVRHAYQSGYAWPMRLFMLKRCFMELRFKTENGKELVLVNTHNSAFSDAAEIRVKELGQLKELMLEEYAKGNYVLIGGDWNQNPATFDSSAVIRPYLIKTIRPQIPAGFLPGGWVYAYDPTLPTNRDVDIPYKDGITKTTLIDFFVLSPNIGLIAAETTKTNFAESDHQPVSVRVYLKK